MNFITIEGGEGAGKTTQSKLLEKAFNQSSIKAIYTREPGGVYSAERIRNLLVERDRDQWSPITELLLHNAARYEHAKKIIHPALKENKVVICDRFVDSTMAYQGYGQKIGKKLPAILHNLVIEGLSPDITFILDIDPKEGLKRVAENKDRYELMGIEFHERVQKGFHDIANIANERCILIDAMQPQEKVHEKIINTLNMKFNLSLKTAELNQIS